MIFSARVCNFITANRYLRIGETLIPRRRFPFRNPAFVLFCTCVNSKCNRSFLFPLVFTLCSSCLPVAHCRSCASLPYASPGSYSVVPRFGIIPVLKGCMAPCLQLSLTPPSIDKAARWITAYLTESSKSPASIARSNKKWVGDLLVPRVVQATPDKLRSSYSVISK